MKPHSHEEHIQHTFDAFCKKVLRNEARDYLDELARKRNREISFSDLPVEVMEQLSTCDIYFVEKQSFGVLDYRVHIDNDELAGAIAALPAQKRDIILLSYFSKSISRVLCASSRVNTPSCSAERIEIST